MLNGNFSMKQINERKAKKKMLMKQMNERKAKTKIYKM